MRSINDALPAGDEMSGNVVRQNLKSSAGRYHTLGEAGPWGSPGPTDNAYMWKG